MIINAMLQIFHKYGLRFLFDLNLIICLHGHWSAYFHLDWLISFRGDGNHLHTRHCLFHNAFIRCSSYPFGNDILAFMRTSLPFSIVNWWVGFYIGRSFYLLGINLLIGFVRSCVVYIHIYMYINLKAIK